MEFWQGVESQSWKQSSLGILDWYLSTKPHSVFLDIGAWIGPLSLYAAHIATTVYAIEADPTAFSALNANFKLNPTLEVRTRLFFECILAQSAPQTQMVGVGDGTSRIAEIVNDVGLRGGASWPVKCRSLSDFFSQEKIALDSISLLSLDVVGVELDILASMPLLFKAGGVTAAVNKPAILLNVYAPAWKDAESADHALRVAAAWKFVSTYKFIYQVDTNNMSPVKKDDGPAFCVTQGCLMLLSDVEYGGAK
jgi:FkbM family methyltransferase